MILKLVFSESGKALNFILKYQTEKSYKNAEKYTALKPKHFELV